MLSDIVMWNKIGRIIMLLSNVLGVKPERAMDVFYQSKTNERLHDANEYLYMMSDQYVVDELMMELQGS